MINYLLYMGNANLNSIYEENQKRVKRYKPMDESISLMRESYVKKKYIQKACLVKGADDELSVNLVCACERFWKPISCSLQGLYTAAMQGDAVGVLRGLANGADINW